MRKGFETIIIFILALGLMGIILGVSIGLYRNDMLAKLQAVQTLNEEESSQDQLEDPMSALDEQENIQLEASDLDDLLLWGDLHTKFLAAGTVLSVSSVILFLISLRSKKD